MKECNKCLGTGSYYVSHLKRTKQQDGSINTSDWGYYMPCECQKVDNSLVAIKRPYVKLK